MALALASSRKSRSDCDMPLTECKTCIRVNARRERTVVRHSEPLPHDLRAAMRGYFLEELLGSLRTITLTGGARIPLPPFYAEAREMGGGRFPDFVHMRSVTYIDVIVFHDEIDVRALFHGLVHAAQMAVLGFEKYMELYVRGFAKNLSWLVIPLEDQAYKLDARYAENPAEVFEKLFAGEAFEVGHLAFHLFARGVGGGADTLDAELELIGVRSAHQRFIESDEILAVEIEERLIESLHAVLRAAGGDGVVDEASFVGVDDAIADIAGGNHDLDGRDAALLVSAAHQSLRNDGF
jgi:hypothetical protein